MHAATEFNTSYRMTFAICIVSYAYPEPRVVDVGELTMTDWMASQLSYDEACRIGAHLTGFNVENIHLERRDDESCDEERSIRSAIRAMDELLGEEVPS